MDTDIISVFLLYTFSVRDVFLPVNLGYFAELMASAVSPYNLDFIIRSDGHRSCIVPLSQLERGGDTIFLQMREDALKCIQCFLLWLEDIACESGKASQRYWTHVCACCCSDGHKRRFNSVFLVKRLLNIQIVSVTSYLHHVIFHLKIIPYQRRRRRKYE